MATVNAPFFSIWASGSLKKTLTCTPLKNGSFKMSKHLFGKRGIIGGQKYYCDMFTWRAKRAKYILKYPDLAVEITSYK